MKKTELKPLLTELRSRFPKVEFETPHSKASGESVIQVQGAQLLETLAWFAQEKREWSPEGMTACQYGRSLSINYWLTSGSSELVIQAVYVLPKEDRVISAPSVTAVWPQLIGQEQELGLLFGVQFLGQKNLAQSAGILPWSGEGFPLRKNYAPPS